MIEYAHAKINLCLDVKRRKEDGYHELESIFLPLTLCDILEIEPIEGSRSIVICNEPQIPTDERNLIHKAISLMQNTYGISQQFQVLLQKRIPTEAGLGGGSSDAAATLRALNQLLDLRLSTATLQKMGKTLGADVPFFIESKSAYAEGIGEKLIPIDISVFPHILLVKPHVGISTKEAFQQLDLKTCAHPDSQKVQTLLKQQNWQAMYPLLGNSLEDSAMQLQPEIQEIKQALLAFGFDCALMSGSGSTVFALTMQEEVMKHGSKEFQNKGYFVCETNVKV